MKLRNTNMCEQVTCLWLLTNLILFERRVRCQTWILPSSLPTVPEKPCNNEDHEEAEGGQRENYGQISPAQGPLVVRRPWTGDRSFYRWPWRFVHLHCHDRHTTTQLKKRMRILEMFLFFSCYVFKDQEIASQKSSLQKLFLPTKHGRPQE